MHRTRTQLVRSGIAALTLIVVTGLLARDAHAQAGPGEGGPRLGFAIRHVGFALGAALGLELFAPRVWFELHAAEVPEPPPPPPYAPPPPCCYAPPPPVVMVAPLPPPAPPPEPTRFGFTVSGLFQSAASGQTAIAGMAAALQMRTSPHSLFGLELQSLASDRQTTGSRRDEMAGLMVGRLFAWDAALAPYLELAGGLGRASIDTQALEVSAQQLIGRAGLGIELRLGPHLVLDTQVAQIHRLRFDDQPSTMAANDPTSIGRHEQSTELRLGLGYRF